MGLVRVVPPTEEPVHVDELLTHVKPVESGEEMDLLEGYIAAATPIAETFLRRALCQQQWRWTLDQFPCSGRILKLPKPPLISLDEVRYLDWAGTLTLLASTVYTVDLNATPGRLALAFGQVWPSTRPELAAVQVLFTCGWAKAKDIPEGIKVGLCMLIATWYAHRESIKTGTIVTELPDNVRKIWQPFRLPYFR